jgi:hypothetical protein
MTQFQKHNAETIQRERAREREREREREKLMCSFGGFIQRG